MPDGPFLPPVVVPAPIARMPKCNLHTHLEGSVRPATLVSLAKAQGIALPTPEDRVAAALAVTGHEQSLVDYLACIALCYPVLKSAEALRRTSREAAEDAAAGNVRYFELRAGPATHATADLPVREVIAAMLAGLADAESACNITCRLIVAALRHHPPELNAELARAALDFRGAGVVGFDLAGDEAAYPAALHREAFEIARQGGLGITVHAGEAGRVSEVAYAVTELHATRIGHGVRAVDDPATVQLLVDRGITLEMCPSSNVHTATVPSMAAHPIAQLRQRGVRITIGDDDPVTSRTDVARELTLLQQTFGWGADVLAEFECNGLRASFLEEGAHRERLWAEFGSELACERYESAA
jgi:adenosine deaminase